MALANNSQAIGRWISAGPIPPPGWHIFSLAVYDSHLYAGTYTGYVYRYDGGTKWTDIGQTGDLNGVMVLEVYNNLLFAGKHAGEIYYYQDWWSPNIDAID